MLATAARHAHPGAVAVRALNRPPPTSAPWPAAPGRLCTTGNSVDWTPWFPATPRPSSLDLPTYPFQRQRSGWAIGRIHSLGPVVNGLTAATCSAVRSQRPMAAGRGDHVIGGAALLPGTALLGWALRGDEARGSGVAELALEAPVVLPWSGGLHVQVEVSPAATQPSVS